MYQQPIPVRTVPGEPIDELSLMERASDHTTNVAVTSTLVIAVCKHRTAVWIVNDSDTIIYLALGVAAVVNQGIRLNAGGGSFTMSKADLFKGDISAIHGGAGAKVLCAIQLESRYSSR